ncbi:unnamed protein product [Laminaria digitata]
MLQAKRKQDPTMARQEKQQVTLQGGRRSSRSQHHGAGGDSSRGSHHPHVLHRGSVTTLLLNLFTGPSYFVCAGNVRRY